MRYILKIDEAGEHSITDEDLDQPIESLEGFALELAGLTLRQAIKVDLNDTLGWKKSGYHPEAIKHKLISKAQSENVTLA